MDIDLFEREGPIDSGVEGRGTSDPVAGRSFTSRERCCSFCSVASAKLSATRGVTGSERFPLTFFIQLKMPSELRRLWSMLWDVEGRAEIVAEPEGPGRLVSLASVKDWWSVFGAKVRSVVSCVGGSLVWYRSAESVIIWDIGLGRAPPAFLCFGMMGDGAPSSSESM